MALGDRTLIELVQFHRVNDATSDGAASVADPEPELVVDWGHVRPTFWSIEGTPCVVFPHFLEVEIKVVATKCQILRLKFAKFEFGWGSAPDPAGGSLPRSPAPQLDLRGHTSKDRARMEKEIEKELKGEDSVAPSSGPPTFYCGDLCHLVHPGAQERCSRRPAAPIGVLAGGTPAEIRFGTS